MKTIYKIIALLVWCGIAAFIWYLISLIPGTIGKIIFVTYGIVVYGLTFMFALGLGIGWD